MSTNIHINIEIFEILYTNTAKVWAFGTVVLQPGPLVPATSQAALAKLHTFDPQELANTVWALAKLPPGCPVLLLVLWASKLASAPPCLQQLVCDSPTCNEKIRL